MAPHCTRGPKPDCRRTCRPTARQRAAFPPSAAPPTACGNGESHSHNQRTHTPAVMCHHAPPVEQCGDALCFRESFRWDERTKQVVTSTHGLSPVFPLALFRRMIRLPRLRAYRSSGSPLLPTRCVMGRSSWISVRSDAKDFITTSLLETTRPSGSPPRRAFVRRNPDRCGSGNGLPHPLLLSQVSNEAQAKCFTRT